MQIQWRILTVLGLLLCLGMMIHAFSASAQTSQKTIHSPDGWVVKYGVVNGAATQSQAIVAELRSVAKNCGESPQVGKPFRYKGTTTVGVFYVVRDHSAQNIPRMGLILSDFDEQKRVETALMYDDASRFPKTLNPMMEAVFKEWRPGSTKPAANTLPAKAASSGALLPMHSVTLQDGTASAKVPDGWQLGPMSHGGTIEIIGSHQEFILLNGGMLAQDPRAPSYQSAMRMHLQMPAIKVVMPYNTDASRAFPNLYLSAARVLQWNPTDLKIEHADVTSTSGGRCVQGQGQVNNFGNGPMELNGMFCLDSPSNPQTGIYMIYVYLSLLPASLADQERLTASTVMASFSWNKAMIEQLAREKSAPEIAAMQGMYQDHMHALTQFTQSQIERTHEIGRQATERYEAADRQRVESSQRFDKQEENISRYGQGFSNYLLDQNVIEYTDTYGDVVHQTVPNNIAYSLVQHHPDQVEIVDTPNYIPEIDFRK